VNPRKQLLFNRDKNLLMTTKADCNRLKDAMGTEGLRLLEEHCATLGTLEQRLTQPVQRTSSDKPMLLGTSPQQRSPVS
jgi:hypothetical protein